MRTAFDLLVIAALSKELLAVVQRGILPFNLFLAGMLGVPFLLGIAGQPKRLDATTDYVREMIRTSVSLFALILYVGLQQIQGLAWMFSGVFLSGVLAYLLGRLAGTMWRLLWALLGLLVGAYVLMVMSQRG